MDSVFESDAEALWQDTLDLLEEQHISEPLSAMLKSCEPLSLEDTTLTISTSMRLVQKTILKNSSTIENCLAQAAFENIALEVALVPASDRAGERTPSHQAAPEQQRDDDLWDNLSKDVRVASNPLVETITDNDSRLTFKRFIQGDENIFAYQAALQVAEGVNKQTYNPLFIYGKSGLGKTHLLRAIQNYISKNDPMRLCVYKDASTFMSEYVNAMQNRDKGDFETLKNNYHGIDVLIIDDIQTFLNKTNTITFFFDLFNYLSSNGKQIVLAADRSPAQLGMGKSGFDERITSRLGSGFSISIQVPSFELKLLLITAFYKRQKEDAQLTHIPFMDGAIAEADLRFMAEHAGSNIRDIEGFVQSCIIMAARRQKAGEFFSHDDIMRIADEKWPMSKKQVTVAQIQRLVETYYDVSHNDLIGDKRNKELMEPRHIAIWLSRELTDSTLADIGKRFGGRSHATIKHSISWVEKQKKEDKTFYDQIFRIHDTIVENS